jgi:hypothetical protein
MYSTEASARKAFYVDLAGAVMAGLVSAYEISRRSDGGGVYGNDFAKDAVLAIGSYAAAAVLCHKFGRGSLALKILGWVLIAVLGSLISVAYMCLSAMYLNVFHPLGWQYRAHPSLAERALTEMRDSIPGVFVLGAAYSLLALPVIALTHYVGSLFRWARSGHDKSTPLNG